MQVSVGYALYQLVFADIKGEGRLVLAVYVQILQRLVVAGEKTEPIPTVCLLLSGFNPDPEIVAGYLRSMKRRCPCPFWVGLNDNQETRRVEVGITIYKLYIRKLFVIFTDIIYVVGVDMEWLLHRPLGSRLTGRKHGE